MRFRDLYPFKRGSGPMLYYALVFAILALVSGFLGFAALGGTMALIAKVFLLVFAVLFVLSLFFGRGRRPAL